jgi:hypothetical protein
VLSAAAILGALAHAAWTNLREAPPRAGAAATSGAHPRRVLRAVADKRRLAPEARPVTRILAEAVPRGNILVRFEGFGPKDGDARRLLYYQGVYHLYPRRFYACDPGVTVGLLPEAPFAPGPEWLEQHDIEGVAILSPNEGGGTRFSFVPRAKARPPGPEAAGGTFREGSP